MDIAFDFKKIVDSLNTSIVNDLLASNCQDDLIRIYSHFGFTYETNLTFSNLKNHVYQKIKNILVGKDLKVLQLDLLKQHFIFTYFVEDLKLQPYLRILKLILESVREEKQLAGFQCYEQWCNAIQISLDFIIFEYGFEKAFSENIEIIKKEYPKQFNISQSIKTLQSKGCYIKIIDGKPFINYHSLKKIANHIQNDIKKIGGIKTLSFLFQAIQHKYCNEQGRYHFGRIIKNSIFVLDADFPVGYLLNLSVKFLDSPNIKMRQDINEKESKRIWQEILQNSYDMACVLDVEHNNIFQLILNDCDRMVDFTTKLALYDSLFCPIQLRPYDVPKMIRGLFYFCHNQIQQKLGWTPNQAAEIAEKILELSCKQKSTTNFNVTQIYESVALPKNIVDSLLTVLSYDKKTVNNGFHTPQDRGITQNYFQYKPLIKLSKDKYCLINPSISSPGFYEAIISEIRQKIDKNINDKIGENGVEYFVKNQLNEHNVDYKSGDYEIKINSKPNEYNFRNAQNLQVDILIETSDILFFLEVKSKPLTRQSQDGNSLKLFSDLCNSLLASQIQLVRHKIYIIKYNKIFFKNGNLCQLNGRKVALVSLTLLDYGSFQDRSFIFQFLKNMLLGEFEINESLSEQDKQELHKINKKLKEFKDEFDELCKLDPQEAINPFYNCWFLSVPQLLVILDKVDSNDDFKQEIFRTRSVTTGCLDFYNDYYQILKLK